ncbi:hypothetical protein [Salinibacter ruber]|uniref:hypothetical protein n=1 Tax=Salinibacter ruber TaxID=146919 RepID=UPI002168848B|nr:hypothetical protein [Salinibacter ruber]MCS4174575.1 hypothetical protein [Salinibacter ruber]
MRTYHESAESSNSRGRPYLSRANFRYLAAKLERLAQELHTGKIPKQEELAVDEDYQAGRLLGYEMDTNTSVVLAGIVDGLRRVAKHRRAAVWSGDDDDLSPSVYPLVSSALEEVGQS